MPPAPPLTSDDPFLSDPSPDDVGTTSCASGSDRVSWDTQHTVILVLYFISVIVWVWIVHALGIAPWTSAGKVHGLNGKMGWFLFFIPVLVMGLAVASVVRTSEICKVQNAVRGGNVLYLGILIAIPLFTLLDASYQGDRSQFAMVILVAMILAVLSQLDVWGTSRWTCAIQHAESSLKTLSIGLLLFVIALYTNNGRYIST